MCSLPWILAILINWPELSNARIYIGVASDSAIKQILLYMNEKRSFIIEDLDEHHVVIKADEEYRVRKELESEVSLSMKSQVSLSEFWLNVIEQLEKNTYSLDQQPTWT